MGTREFVDRIKSDYLSETPDIELPQQAKILKDMDAESLLERAAGILQCKVKDFHQAARISKSDKDKRDLLIYILWEMGLFSNQEIGFLFGLTYSSISRRVSITMTRIRTDEEFKKRLEQFNSLIKV